MYDCKAFEQSGDLETVNPAGLVGTYDILYCHGHPMRDSRNEGSGRCVSRSIQGSLDLCLDQFNSREVDHEEPPVLQGTVQILKSRIGEDAWEPQMQLCAQIRQSCHISHLRQ